MVKREISENNTFFIISTPVFISALQSKISQQHNAESSVEQFRETVREYLNVTELTPYILNKLISKIEISSLEMVDGEKQQMVSVEWKIESIY